MVIDKGKDNERPVCGMGSVLQDVRAQQDDEACVQPVSSVAQGTRAEKAEAPYNQTEEGAPLRYPGKISGRRKLRDEDVIRLRRNEEQLSYNHWARVFNVAMSVIFKAMKGYTYKHLNWRYPPIR